MISKITLQQLCREQILDRGAYDTFKEVQKAIILPSKGCLTVKILPFLTQELERGAEAEGKVGIIAMQLEEKL